MSDVAMAYMEIKRNRQHLNRQQVRTLQGQLRAGDVTGAMKGLNNILERKGV